MFHRIFRTCSFWKNFHVSLEKAKTILSNNQYPQAFYEPILRDCLSKIIKRKEKTSDEEKEDEADKLMLFL